VSDLPAAAVAAMPPDDGIRVGIVAGINPLRVTLQGAPVTLLGRLSGTSLSVGDSVAMIRQDGSWLVLGTVVQGDSAAPTDRNIVNGTTSALTWGPISSATFADVAGASVSFVRQRPNSRLRFSLLVSARQTGGATVVGAYALRVHNPVTGAEWAPTILPAVSYSAASIQVPATIERVLLPTAALGTGSLVAQLQVRRLSGTGTISSNSGGDTFSLTVEEV